jgi:TatD DNase family protein
LYINIHSHHKAGSNQWVLQNLLNEFDQQPAAGLYSAGLHPWHLTLDTWQQQLADLKKASKSPNIIAIGECGLDKACSTNYALQQEVFVAQLLWANEINKPVIIHCVRAYDDILRLLQVNNNTVPIIFHGFNKQIVLAKKILEAGHYLSFGRALFQPAMAAVFLSVPPDQYFLETDDAAISIEEIYQAAITIKNISAEGLDLQLRKNVKKVFNITL